MPVHPPLRPAAGLFLALALAAGCARDPVAPPPSPLVYSPPGTQLRVAWDQRVRFEVRTPEGVLVPTTFYLDGDSVQTGLRFDWWVDRPGPATILAQTRWEETLRTHQWTARLDTTTLEPVGPVRLPRVFRIPVEGALEYDWLRPHRDYGQPEMDHYELAIAPEAFSAGDAAGWVVTTLPHRLGVDDYEYTARNLVPGTMVYARIRAVDRARRSGPWSELLSAVPVARFDRSGKILQADAEGLSFTPQAGVQVTVQDRSAITGADGRYFLSGLLDYLPAPMRIDPPVVPAGLYPLRPMVESTGDRVVDYLLLPRRTVPLLLPSPAEWSFLRFLRTLTAMDSTNDRIAHWEQYPVPVQLPPVAAVGQVDCRASMLRAVQIWNDAAGRPVLSVVEEVPARGAFTTMDLPRQGGGSFGEVTLALPKGGTLYHTVPILVHLALAESFDSQELADRVILHELGHVLYLTHSPSIDHVMSAGVNSTSPNQVHPDEAAVLRVLMALPNGTRMSWYSENLKR